MVKIITKINEYITGQKGPHPFFSFEFFPPKTEAGIENLYQRIDRMTTLQPIFVDVTMGIGGTTKDTTIAICQYIQTYFGIEALLHLTCTNMLISDLKEILIEAKKAGIHNILVIRGDKQKDSDKWEPIPGGLNHAIDLIKLIKQEHGDYFGIAIGGVFPEQLYSHDSDPSINANDNNNVEYNEEQEYQYIKDKIDAGADFILTNFFYDINTFITYYNKCRLYGITCPIIPGILPIQNYKSFKSLVSYANITIPAVIHETVENLKNDHDALKKYGLSLAIIICKELIVNNKCNILGYHFYTLNLEYSVLYILKVCSHIIYYNIYCICICSTCINKHILYYTHVLNLPIL